MQEWLTSLFVRLRQQKGMTTWIWIVILFVILGIGTLMGMPFDRPGTTGQAVMPAFGSTGQLISVFLKWMAVIGLMYVAFIFLKRWQPGGAGSQVKQLKVVERLALSQKQAVLLVKVGKRSLLLGATDQSISLITELQEGDAFVPEISLGAAQDGSEASLVGESGNGFNSLLKKKMAAGPAGIFGDPGQKKD